MIDNLDHIREHGIGHFVASEVERWTCPQCGELLCVHTPKCAACTYTWR
jgi:hypothetical protein